MSWLQLLDICKQAREEAEFYASRPPQACPNDGEPLLPAPDGASGDVELYCRFDGFRWPRDRALPGEGGT